MSEPCKRKRPPLLKVRAITTFVKFSKGQPEQWRETLQAAAKFNETAAARFTAGGFEVQTTRIAANSFEEWCDVKDAEATLAAFRTITSELKKLDCSFFNAGPARSAAALEVVPDVIALGSRISCSGALADPHDRSQASALAAAILRIATLTERGEGNFQFCASFNSQAGTPFFPAAFHDAESDLSFAIGCETAALLAEALPEAHGDLSQAGGLLTRLFEDQLRPVEAIARELEAASIKTYPSGGLRYGGIDASIAPLGTAPPITDSFESLGLGRFGGSGTLAIASLVTGALKAIRAVKLCGYTGLFVPPCEDAGLAARAAEGSYRIHDLLMYSAVCGLGLDTVPIAGSTPPQRLSALLLDVAALAFRLNKPLTARLFPVPGKEAGDMTAFESPFLCNTTCFAVP